MRNKPIYPYLVKYLWVSAEVFDELVAYAELRLLVEKESFLKEKSKEEVGLKKYLICCDGC